MKLSDKDLQSFGDFLNQTAKHLHITQREICAEVGISRKKQDNPTTGNPLYKTDMTDSQEKRYNDGNYSALLLLGRPTASKL